MKNKLAARLRSKTYVTALVGLVLTGIEAQSGAILGWLPSEYRQFAVFLWPIAMMTLREVTSSALDATEDAPDA